MAMFPTVFVVFVGLFTRFIVLKRLVPVYKLRDFAFSIVGKNILLGTFCFIAAYYVHKVLPVNLGTFILTSAIACVIVVLIVYVFGITQNERIKINNKIKVVLKQ